MIEAVKYIIENNYTPSIIYTDSITAISWFYNKKTSSRKRNLELKKAEVFLETIPYKVDKMTVRHWDNKGWGETPADFENK